MKQSLEIGDIVIVSNALFGEREYIVKGVDGNKAMTDFRIFNTKIYPGGNIYEFGKRDRPWSNGYWIKQL